ncbi:HIT family protein [Paenibacillus sp. N3/727]|uniref:HIT family protein n=1 Tax=Paenibacillus sp. N3/727 TaxID=2925845 RepID=UPI001F535E77|nr:HIT family protein [Paenibacillus sp. N3/727]UNK16788.1 HIT family protein [Paenibacillus sp. N3/727]
MNCLGCDLANKREPVHLVYEDNYVTCFLDHAPFNEGHVLILPKRHIRYFDELDEYSANSLIKASMLISHVIKRVFHPDGITVCQNGGMFDELTHFHMHVVPRYEGQNFADFYTEDGDDRIEEETKLAESKRKIIDAIRAN